MKKIVFFAAAGLLCILWSCNEAKEDTTKTTKPPMSARAVYDAIESGDVSKLDSFLAKDIVDHSDRGDIVGRDSVKAEIADIHNHFSDLKMDIISEASDGDYGFTLHTFKGVAKDSTMGMPVGTKVDSKGVDVVRFKDNMIVEHWMFYEAQEMTKMMNMMNRPATAKSQ